MPRLSLFVEARVAVLERAAAAVRAGHRAVGRAVRLPEQRAAAARRRTNDIWFEPPPGPARKVDASPARVALFDAPGSAALDRPPGAARARHPSIRAGTSSTTTAVTHRRRRAGAGRSLAGCCAARSSNFSVQLDLEHRGRAAVSNRTGTSTLRPAIRSPSASSSRPVRLRHQHDCKTVLPGIYGVRGDRERSALGRSVPRPRASNELAFTITPQIRERGPAASPPAPRDLRRSGWSAPTSIREPRHPALGGRRALTLVNDRHAGRRRSSSCRHRPRAAIPTGPTPTRPDQVRPAQRPIPTPALPIPPPARQQPAAGAAGRQRRHRDAGVDHPGGAMSAAPVDRARAAIADAPRSRARGRTRARDSGARARAGAGAPAARVAASTWARAARPAAAR